MKKRGSNPEKERKKRSRSNQIKEAKEEKTRQSEGEWKNI